MERRRCNFQRRAYSITAGNRLMLPADCRLSQVRRKAEGAERDPGKGDTMNTVQPIRNEKDIDHMRKSLYAINPKYGIMFSIGVNTGLRISDILALTIGDIRNKDHVTITEEKTDKTKRFLINKPLQKEINAYIKKTGLQDDSPVIPSKKNPHKPVTRIQAYRVLNDAAEQCGLEEVGTHTLRKTFGYHFYKRTKNVALLMDIFNHSAPSITLRYIGINDKEKDEALEHFYL